MQRISDALELLTAQHDEIEALLAEIAAAPTALRPTAITDLADRITVHLAVEQELFYPAVSTSLSREVHKELLAEHIEIKKALADLLWLDHDDTHVASTIASLVSLLDTHCQWQEKDLFECVAETRSETELADLGREMGTWIDGIIATEEPYEIAASAAA